MRKEGFTAVGSMLLAFLASQHHNVHMLLLAVGVGGAGMSFMSQLPMIRRAMLAMSLIMTAFMLYRLWRRERPRAMRIMGGVSAAVSLGMVAWSIYQFGL